MRLLGLSGSLRAASTNTALLRAAARAAPDGVSLSVFDGLAGLPIFNPDLEDGTLPSPVIELKHRVASAAGLVIACPEYAHGIPGGLKNALDWLVSGAEIPGKPIALLHASPRSQISRAALAEVLCTMSTAIVCEATVPLLGCPPHDVDRVLADPDSIATLASALRRFRAEIERGEAAAR